jgi:hypothetical protein
MSVLCELYIKDGEHVVWFMKTSAAKIDIKKTVKDVF